MLSRRALWSEGDALISEMLYLICIMSKKDSWRDVRKSKSHG